MRGSLVSRIFVGFLIVEASFVVLAWLSLREIEQIAEEIRALRDGQVVTSRHVARLVTYGQKRLEELDGFFETEDPRTRGVILSIAALNYPDKVRQTVERIRSVAFDRIEYNTDLVGPAAQARAADFRRLLDLLSRIEGQHQALDGCVERLRERVALGGPVDDIQAELEGIKQDLKVGQSELEKLLNDATDGAVTRATLSVGGATTRVVAFSALGLFMGLVVTVLAARGLAPIPRLVRYARAIGRGDYEQPIEVAGNYELASLGEALIRMARNRKEREAELDQQAQELERAYRRVEDLKRYHERIVRSLRTALVVTDRSLVVTSANPAAESHWGLSQLRVLGQPLSSLALGAPLAGRLGSLEALVDRDEPLHAKAVPIGPLLADVTVAPLQSEKGTKLGLVVALEDVTEAVRTKEALLRSERLATIGRMGAHVTHEIRNPLSSIGLNAEMLMDIVTRPSEAPNADDAPSLCQAIVREVDRLSAITEEYLRFVRLPQSDFRPTDLRALLGRIAAFIKRDCEAAKVRLEQSVPEVLPTLMIDADQVRQALLNLLRNGKEAMPEGGVLVLGARQPDPTTVELFVRDSGTGIPVEDQERIFDPFYSTKLTGTGLGLALTHQIVADHAAELRVKSTPGRGTEFVISFTQSQPIEIIEKNRDESSADLGAP